MDAEEVTRCLEGLARGDREAGRDLLPLVYDELRRLAARHLARERSDHTLQPTALAHEAWLRLAGQDHLDWRNRAHFMAVAAQAVRRILIDHARRHAAERRGGGRGRITLSESIGGEDCGSDLDLLELDQALEELGKLNPRHRQAIELRFYGGLTLEEAAHVLGVSRQTVELDWRMARAWLRRRLE